MNGAQGTVRVERARECGVTQVGERELLARRDDVEARRDRLFDLWRDRFEPRSRAQEDDVALSPGGGGLLVELPGGRRDREGRAAPFEASQLPQVFTRLVGSRVRRAQDFESGPPDHGARDLDADRPETHQRHARDRLFVHSPSATAEGANLP